LFKLQNFLQCINAEKNLKDISDIIQMFPLPQQRLID
jgi:hypothetical protein